MAAPTMPGQPNPQKRLQLFFDGTANSAAEGRWADATNVFRVVMALHYEGNQIVSYMPGVGTRGDIFSTITARGMDEIVREAYVNLASNYLRGDQIYVFGYSRGGAAALALTEMISQVGLLWADDLDNLYAVWEYYLGRRGRKKLSDAERREVWERHLEPKIRKEDDEPIIKFLGLFDPVPGNGWDTLTHYSNIRLIEPTLSHNVQAAVSILSVDDNRNPSYRPVLLSGKSSNQQSIEQIWMPGVHADVGGNSNDGVFLSDVALLTMIERVKTYCPELVWDEGYIARRREELGKKVEVRISDERFDWKRKFLWRADRSMATKASEGKPRFVDEKLHPVFDCLDGQNFWVRSKWQTYAPSHVPRDMVRFSSSNDELFRTGCERALANTKRR